MPVTTKFEDKGMSNGFPYCPARLDVDSFDFWTTLGGCASGTATAAQLALSVREAMRFFRNQYTFNASASISGSELGLDGSVGPSATVNLWKFILGEFGPELVDLGSVIPKNRACVSADSSVFLQAREVDNNAQINSTFQLYRMYNSGTFIGLGLGAAADISASASGDDGLPSQVNWGGVVNDHSISANFLRDTGHVSFNGFFGVGYVSTGAEGGAISLAGLSASSSYTTAPPDSISRSASALLSSFTPYTYPA